MDTILADFIKEISKVRDHIKDTNTQLNEIKGNLTNNSVNIKTERSQETKDRISQGLKTYHRNKKEEEKKRKEEIKRLKQEMKDRDKAAQEVKKVNKKATKKKTKSPTPVKKQIKTDAKKKDVTNKHLDKIKDHLKEHGQTFSQGFSKVDSFFSEMTAPFKEIGDVLYGGFDMLRGSLGHLHILPKFLMKDDKEQDENLDESKKQTGLLNDMLSWFKKEDLEDKRNRQPKKREGFGFLEVAGLIAGALGTAVGVLLSPIIFLSSVFVNLAKVMGSIYKTVKGSLSLNIAKVFGPEGVLGRIGVLFEKLANTKIGRLVGNVKGSIANVLGKNGLIGKISELFSWIGSKVTAFKTTIKSIISSESIFGKFLKPLVKILQSAAKLGGRFVKAIPVIGQIIWIMDILWKTISGFFSGFKKEGFIGGIKGALSGFFNGFLGGILNLVKDVISWTAKLLGFEGVSQYLDSFDFNTIFKNMLDTVFGISILETLGINKMFTEIGTLLSDVYDAVTTPFKNLWAKISNIKSTSTVDLIVSTIKILWTDLISAMIDSITGGIEAVIGWIKENNPFSIGGIKKLFKMSVNSKDVKEATVDIEHYKKTKEAFKKETDPAKKEIYKTNLEKMEAKMLKTSIKTTKEKDISVLLNESVSKTIPKQEIMKSEKEKNDFNRNRYQQQIYNEQVKIDKSNAGDNQYGIFTKEATGRKKSLEKIKMLESKISNINNAENIEKQSLSNNNTSVINGIESNIQKQNDNKEKEALDNTKKQNDIFNKNIQQYHQDMKELNKIENNNNTVIVNSESEIPDEPENLALVIHTKAWGIGV